MGHGEKNKFHQKLLWHIIRKHKRTTWKLGGDSTNKNQEVTRGRHTKPILTKFDETIWGSRGLQGKLQYISSPRIIPGTNCPRSLMPTMSKKVFEWRVSRRAPNMWTFMLVVMGTCMWVAGIFRITTTIKVIKHACSFELVCQKTTKAMFKDQKYSDEGPSRTLLQELW